MTDAETVAHTVYDKYRIEEAHSLATRALRNSKAAILIGLAEIVLSAVFAVVWLYRACGR